MTRPEPPLLGYRLRQQHVHCVSAVGGVAMSDGMPREIWAWQSDPEDDDNWENGHIQAWEGSGECGDGTTRYIRADADAEVRKALADKLTNEEISIEKAQSLIADAVVDLSPEYKIALNRRFDSKERANLKRLRSM